MSLARRDFLTLPLLAALARPVRADEALVDRWAELRGFAGTWSGTQKGIWGDGVGIRTFRFFIHDGFLEMRTTMRFDPQPANPEGQIRQDYGVMNYDRRGQRFNLRRYYPDELFIEYQLKEMEPVSGRFAWVSERLENGMPDVSVHYTVDRDGADKFTETTVLMRPNAEPRTVAESLWERVR